MTLHLDLWKHHFAFKCRPNPLMKGIWSHLQQWFSEEKRGIVSGAQILFQLVFISIPVIYL